MENSDINRLIQQARILDEAAAAQRAKGNARMAYVMESRASNLRRRTGVFAR